jgi:AraC-like DNA-binding protein
MKSTKRKSLKNVKIYIRNMVCGRCIKVVREELQRNGFDPLRVDLGEVELTGPIHEPQLQSLRTILQQNGFELLENKNGILIEAIKRAIITLVHHNHNVSPMRMKYSAYLQNEVGRDYHSLSTLFSSVENITIEQYIIKQKIERVKELIKYGELTLSEIALQMNYSSVQHLSTQFKRYTGLTPSRFKLQLAGRPNIRLPLDKV